MGSDDSLPLEQLDQLDRLCGEFEEAWKKGKPLDLKTFVGQADVSIREPLFKACLKLDYHYRRQRGEAIGPEFYREQFPKHVVIIDESLCEPEETMPHTPDGEPSESDAPNEEVLPRRFGPYELLEKLGAGGMGVVYRANQFKGERVLRQVALKMIRPERLAVVLPEHREELLERFRIETENAASLEHDNIVRVYEVGEIDGVPYFTMAMIEGTSLHKLIRETTLDGKTAALILEPVARALEYAHEQQVIHRDIKPENILLDDAQTPYLADFGLAKALDVAPEVSVTGQVLGTPPYMSPEQVNGGDLDHRTDVYSLGATLYECLTGRPPFRAADFMQTLRQVANDEPIPPRRIDSSIARDVDTICLKCLEKPPDARYGSARALADDLKRYGNGEPVVARPIGPLRRTWRICKRYRIASSAIAVSMLLLIVVVVVTVVANFRLEAERQRGDRILYRSLISTVDREVPYNPLALDPARYETAKLLDLCPDSFRHWEWHYLRGVSTPPQLEPGYPSKLVPQFLADINNQSRTLKSSPERQPKETVDKPLGISPLRGPGAPPNIDVEEIPTLDTLMGFTLPEFSEDLYARTAHNRQFSSSGLHFLDFNWCTGKLYIRHLPEESPSLTLSAEAATFVPDPNNVLEDKLLIVTSSGVLQKLTIAKGKVVQTEVLKTSINASRHVTVRASPSGRFLVVGTFLGRIHNFTDLALKVDTLEVVDLNDGSVVLTREIDSDASSTSSRADMASFDNAVSFDEADQTIALLAKDPHVVEVMSLENGGTSDKQPNKRLRTFAHNDRVNAILLNRSATELLTISGKAGEELLTRWNVRESVMSSSTKLANTDWSMDLYNDYAHTWIGSKQIKAEASYVEWVEFNKQGSHFIVGGGEATSATLQSSRAFGRSKDLARLDLPGDWYAAGFVEGAGRYLWVSGWAGNTHRQKNRTQIFDLKEGRFALESPLPGTVIASRGKNIATYLRGSRDQGGSVTVANWKTGTRHVFDVGSSRYVTDATYSADESYLVIVESKPTQATSILQKEPDQTLVFIHDLARDSQPSPITCGGATVSSTAKHVATVSAGNLKVWALPDRQLIIDELIHEPHESLRLLFSPGGKTLAVIGKQVRLFSMDSQRLKVITQAEPEISASFLSSTHIATQKYITPKQTIVEVWDIRSGKLVASRSDARLVAFHGDRILCGHAELPGQLTLWNWRNGEAVELSALNLGDRFLDGDPVVSFTPDGKRVAVVFDPPLGPEPVRLRLFDTWDGKQLLEITAGHAGAFTFGPDGRHLLVGDEILKGTYD